MKRNKSANFYRLVRATASILALFVGLTTTMQAHAEGAGDANRVAMTSVGQCSATNINTLQHSRNDSLHADATQIATQSNFPQFAGLNADEIFFLLQKQIELNEHVPTISEVAGSRLAGIWIEWLPNPVLIVSMTTGHPVPAIATLTEGVAAELEIRYDASVSRDQLVSAIEDLAPAIADTPSIIGSYIDEPDNIVVIITLETALLNDPSAIDEITEVTKNLNVPHKLAVQSGDFQLENRGGRYLTGCTSGFTVHHPSTDSHGFLTAGHCKSSQYYKWWSDNSWHASSFVSQQWDSILDVQWHRINPSVQQTAPIFHTSISSTRPQSGVYSGLTTGRTVCKWGTRSVVTGCGTVNSVYFAPAKCGPTEGPCLNSFVDVNLGSIKTCHGDSGGPWYISNYAAGIHSGSGPYNEGDSCTHGSNRHTFFTPISSALSNLGLDLFTP